MDSSTWQKRLLPFLVIVISAMAVCFIVFYFIHISNVEKALENTPQFPAVSKSTADYNLSRWNDLKDLERFTITNRYYNARLIIRSRLLMISLSFLTGVILCFVGSIFILGKFSEDATTIEGGQEKMSFKLASSSPGIILSFLGVIIIITSILSKTDVNVSDSPLFMPEPKEESFTMKLDSTSLKTDSLKEKDMNSIMENFK